MHYIHECIDDIAIKIFTIHDMNFLCWLVKRDLLLIEKNGKGIRNEKHKKKEKKVWQGERRQMFETRLAAIFSGKMRRRNRPKKAIKIQMESSYIFLSPSSRNNEKKRTKMGENRGK